MIDKKKFMGLRFFLVLLVGSFFLLGSVGFGPAPQKQENPHHLLPPDKKKKYEDLKEKRDYAKNVRNRRYKDYWEKRDEEVGDRRARLERRAFDTGLEKGEFDEHGETRVPTFTKGFLKDIQGSETKYVKHAPGAHELHNEIVKIDKHVKQINKQMDDLLKETRHTCFPPETLVLLGDGSYKAIKDMKVGDEVTIYDIAKDNIGVSSVKAVSISDNNHFYQINDSIKATAYERFYTQDGWKKIRELKVGDGIFDGNGFEEIVNIKKEEVSSTVYNLSIHESYNFFVSIDGKTNMLVHNTPGGGGGGSSGGGSGGGK